MMKRIISLMFLTLGVCIACMGQPREVLDIAAQYPDENAVLRSNTQALTFTFEGRELKAYGSVSKEVLLLSGLAPGMYNTAEIYHSALQPLLHTKAYSNIPNKNAYKTIPANLLKTTSSPSENIFFDDTKVSVWGFSGLTRYASTVTTYEVAYPNLGFLPVFYFQSHIPCMESSLKITAPKSVRIKAVLKDIDPAAVTATTEEKKGNIIYTWTARNMPRYREYPNAPSSPAGLARILPYVSTYTPPGADKAVNLVTGRDDLYRFMYRFIENVNKTEDDAVKKKALELAANCSTDSCKAEHIYKWVQQHIKYVAFEDSLEGFIPREAANVYRRKYGDCKDMTSLLISMYRAIGLDACFAWVGTRDHPYTFADAPLPLLFNHVICAWQNGKKEWVFIDGTHSTIKFGVPPYAIQGKETLIARSADAYDIITIPEMDAAMNVREDTTWLSLGAQDELQGEVSIRYSGYPSWTLMSRMNTNSEKDMDKMIKSVSRRASNKYFQKSGRYEINGEQVAFFSDFTVQDYIQKSGNEIYLNLNLLRYNSTEKVADTDLRKLPLENMYKAQTREVLIFTIPEGYKVAYLPPDAEHQQDKPWSYKLSYRNAGRQIIYTKEYTEPMLYLSPELFEQHNRLIDELNAYYKESVILKADGHP